MGCGSCRCAEGPGEGPGVPAGTRWCPVYQWLGPGNTNVRMGGYYTGYYPPTHPGYTPPTNPWYRTARTACPRRHGAVPWEHAHMTVSEAPKEILGVEYAQVHTGTVRARTGCVCTAATSRPCSPAPPSAPARTLISQISVYISDLSIYLRSQLISDPS